VQESKITKLGILPIAYEFIEELGLSNIFDLHIESGDEEISHGKVLIVMILNLLDSPSPLYQISDWLSSYADGIGEFGKESHKFHDKGLGSSLDALYAANRHSLLSELSGKVIYIHKICTDVVHNDSTSVTFIGNYAQNQARGSEIVMTQGYNKDHRSDCKQLLFGLNVSGDGYVPLLAQLDSGNKSDDQTHQANWQRLRKLLNRKDFIYIADSKLSSTENLVFISEAGGVFISILPRTRKEVQDFYKRLEEIIEPDSEDLPCNWEETYQVENSRKKGNYITYRLKEVAKTKEGFRLLWVYSSAKAKQDEYRRATKIKKSQLFLEELKPKLNRYYLKTKKQIQAAIKKGLGKNAIFFDIQVIEVEEIIEKQKGKGRPGVNTEREKKKVISYEIQYAVSSSVMTKAANKDGIFPLVTNTKLAKVEVLKNYKNQPYLEKRFNSLKPVLEVAPVFLKKPERVEAMLFLYIIALMLIALIERRIRKNMVNQNINTLPILPQNMKTKKPTWSNIKFCFNNVIMLSVLFRKQEDYWQSQIKGIGKKQRQVLDLLDISETKYTEMTPDWWLKITDRGG